MAQIGKRPMFTPVMPNEREAVVGVSNGDKVGGGRWQTREECPMAKEIKVPNRMRESERWSNGEDS